MKVVILAGGSGTRLWPYSRNNFPKQFLHFGEEYSLLQKTIRRFLPIAKPSEMLIVTNQDYFHHVKTQVGELDPELAQQILVEPERKNTAPAIALAYAYLADRMKCDPSETFLVSSSDHLISPEDRFLEAVQQADLLARKGRHVIFGIRPHKPETGYGYILADKSGNVQRFVEKPDYALAQQYLLSGDYLWNSGIFLFQMELFQKELGAYCPEIESKLHAGFEQAMQHFSEMPEISIDYALMEKSKRVSVLPLDLTWSDVGSWDSVYDAFEKDSNQNVKVGNVMDIDTKNCLIMGGKRLISTIGLEDLLVVETDDALLIGKKGESQRVKQLVEELKKKNAKEPYEHLTSHRPWGRYTVLEEGERYKIKRIVVEPGQKLSLQMHYHRSEHWVVVQGTAKVTLGEKEQILHENESIFVQKGQVHRLENPGRVRLELIEVQVGEYVGEDDIVRLEDVYQRS